MVFSWAEGGKAQLRGDLEGSKATMVESREVKSKAVKKNNLTLKLWSFPGLKEGRHTFHTVRNGDLEGSRAEKQSKAEKREGEVKQS